jgi:hypothetical protein
LWQLVLELMPVQQLGSELGRVQDLISKVR